MKNCKRRNTSDVLVSILLTLMAFSMPVQALPLSNPGFESGTDSWIFFSNEPAGSVFTTTTSNAFEGTKSALVFLKKRGTNMQLFQPGLTLEPDTQYRLSFAAKSSSGHDLVVRLIKHGAPYKNYGLEYKASLDKTWKTFSIDFTTSDFSGIVDDGRLVFWLAKYGNAGDVYNIDDVKLEKRSSGGPIIITNPSSKTVTEGNTATFSVAAKGAPPLTYQWQKNGADIPDAKSASYTTLPATLPDNGSIYRVNVTNTFGTVTSTGATLTVMPALPPVVIDNTPTGTNVPVTSPIKVTFSKPMNKLSAQGAFLTDTSIAGDFSWTGNTMIFTPDSSLPYSTAFSVTIGTDAKDLDGLSMTAPYTWGFTTAPPPENLIKNPGFDSGTANWWFYTNGKGSFTVDGLEIGYDYGPVAHIKVIKAGSNTQLYQKGLPIEPYTTYGLTFDAYSTSGHDLEVKLSKHTSPYTNYGLNKKFNMGTSWQTFTVKFTTKYFPGTDNNGRLMFWFVPYSSAGDNYFIDNVKLEKI